jgi:hypothetical protein
MKYVRLLSVAAFILAADVHCPLHSYASCYFTGATKIAPDGGQLKKYHCSCGDDWWIRE